jgi:hypothetical protein
VRGEIWPLPDDGTADELLAVARQVRADFCFFDRMPGAVAKAHSLGLASGAVVNGPWQRWMSEQGWEQAMLQLAKETDAVRQGLRKAAVQTDQEIAGWADIGVDLILLADDIAYSAGPYLSPKQLERFLLPLYLELRQKISAAGIFAGFHSDGRLDLLLPLLKQAGFQFLSLEPEGIDPIRAWNLLEEKIPLFSGLPAAWLMPGGFLPEREGLVLREWVTSGPLIVSSACGLYHAGAKLSLQGIYEWLDKEEQSRPASNIFGSTSQYANEIMRKKL